MVSWSMIPRSLPGLFGISFFNLFQGVTRVRFVGLGKKGGDEVVVIRVGMRSK